MSMSEGIVPNMLVDYADGLLIGVHNGSTPSDAEWAVYLEHCRRMLTAHGSQLIVTDGGGPNLEQRRRAHEVAGGASVPVAVVSTSRFVRFVANALVVARTNSKVRAFAPEDIDGAYAYLAIEPERRAGIEQRLAALKKGLAAPASRNLRRIWPRAARG